MSTSVLYFSRHGATRSVAQRTADAVGTTAHPIARGLKLPDAQTVVIGLPIYAGTAPRVAVSWLEQVRDQLLERSLYLFIVCLSEGSKAEQQLADGVPSWLVAHCERTFFVGGQVHISELGFFERIIMKRVAGIDTDIDRLNDAAIGELVETLLPASDE